MEFVCFSLIILMVCVMCRRSPFFKNKRKNSPFYYSAISIFSFRFSVERRRHICRKCLQKPSTGSEWGHRHENKPEILISLHYNRFEIIDHPGQIFDRVNETFSRRWWWWWRSSSSSSRKWFVLLPSPIIFFFLLKNAKHLRTFSRSFKVNLLLILLLLFVVVCYRSHDIATSFDILLLFFFPGGAHFSCHVMRMNEEQKIRPTRSEEN